MSFIYAEYNMHHNCIDVTNFGGYILRIDCGKVEEDMIRNDDTEFATYEVLLALEDYTMSYEQACEYVPILTLVDNSTNGVLRYFSH